MQGQHENGNSFSLEQEIFFCLRKIINEVEIYSAKLKDSTGLNASQLSCLLALKSTGSLAPSRLGRYVFLSPSMITMIVDQLEKKELVIRKREAKDRRVIFIELTEKGKEVVNSAPPSFQEQLIKQLAYLKEEEKVSIYENLKKLFSVIVPDAHFDSPAGGREKKIVSMDPSVLKEEVDDS